VRAKAVVFDLFGTVVGDATSEDATRVYAEMGAALSADPDDLRRLWLETYPGRVAGGFATVEENVAFVCERLGLSAGRASIERAAAARAAFIERMMTPRPDAAATLEAVRETGRRVGLLSNCTPEVPPRWPATGIAHLFDATVFSSEVGLRKPDRRIFELASDRVGLPPGACVYVADGDHGELAAAEALGMRSVCVRYPGFDPSVRLAPEDWPGPTISSLREVLPLLD
jgi:putative hydrolase of the HAD superfamily